MPTGTVRETKQLDGDRLRVRLDYPGGTGEDFEWQLFSESQMADFAARANFRLLSAATGFEASKPPSPDNPRIHFVLERGQD